MDAFHCIGEAHMQHFFLHLGILPHTSIWHKHFYAMLHNVALLEEKAKKTTKITNVVYQLVIGISQKKKKKKKLQSQTRNALFRSRSSNKPVRPRLHKVWIVSANSLR